MSKMKIEHVAIWTLDIDKMAKFYEKYFNATIGEKYINQNKRFESVFLTFDEGSRIELMKNQSLQNVMNNNVSSVVGYAHLAISVGSRKNVDFITSDLRSGGFKIIDGPRQTGDGYYESVIFDVDDNKIEITE
jgi:lactoylglutathione lyase